VVRLEATDEQQTVDVLLCEVLRDAFELASGEGALCAELGPAGWRPSVDALPGERSDVPGFESLDPVVDPIGIVAGDDAVSDERSDG